MKSSPPAPVERQYHALRSGGGLVELTGWSRVTLTGSDRQSFLQNFCTNDVKRLAPGQSCEAFFTNVKGKIVGHGLVSCREDEIIILGVPDQAPRLIEHLDRYVIREEVQLRDTTAEWSYLLGTGANIARELAGVVSSEGRSAATGRSPISWNLVGSTDCWLFEIAPPSMSLVLRSLSERGFVVAGAEVFDTARIEAGTPLFGVDFDERNLPQEVGRNEQAISFTKGCYLGQETVARIDALGHVNQQLAGLRFHGTEVPQGGAMLTHNGKAAGHVTSATTSPQLASPLALAMLRREYTAAGTQLESPAEPCEVVALPV